MIGRKLSHYRILEKLGEGGMGAVYLAEDPARGRRVALKVLRPEAVPGERGRERLRREARACVELRHPNITDVYEVGEADGISFIAMELIEGETLRQRLKGGPLPWRELLAIGRQIASALGRAHRHGLVHRDVKPENVMVDSRGRVKVLDFGLSRHLAPGTDEDPGERITQVDRLTRPGAVVGTVEYLSPEQAQGRESGPPGDTFSLGVVLYELATGRRPFHGDNVPSLIHAIVYDHPEPLRAFRPDVPAAVERLLTKALQKRIDRRYPDGARLEAALGVAQVELPSDAARSPAPAHSGATTHKLSFQPATRLIGRRAELDLLREMLRSIGAGSGRAAWVAGEAGCGKSRLLQDLTSHATRHGVRVLWGDCPVREGVRPYHPFTEALSSYLIDERAIGVDALRRHLEEVEPGLGRWTTVLGSLLQLDVERDVAPLSKEQVLDAAAAVLAALSRRRPVLLVLDDLHWADRETLELAGSLLRGLGRMRMLLVGTYRPEDLGRVEPAHPLRSLLDRAEREAASARVALRRLDRDETTELVEELLGGIRVEPTLVDAIFLRTEGNPLFVLELIQVLQAEGALSRGPGGALRGSTGDVSSLPGRIRDIVNRRLRHLEPEDRRVLEAAAVEGAAFRASTLEACLEVGRPELLARLERLQRELHLVHADEDRFRFDHALIREALVGGMSPEVRCGYHRRIGRHLIATAGDRPEWADAIAYQLLQAKEDDDALPFLLIAARTAQRVFANERAIEHLNRAEAILQGAGERGQDRDRCEETLMKVRRRRGDLFRMVGRYDQARLDFERLAEDGSSRGDATRLAMARNRLGELLALQGNYDGALAMVDRARQAAGPLGDRRALADAASVAGQAHYHRGAFEAALSEHTAAMNLCKQLDDRFGVAHALNKIGNIRYYQGEYEAARAAYMAALEMERQLGDRRGMAESLMNLGATDLQRGDEQSSLDHHRAALSIKREVGDRRSLAMSLNNLALVYEATGRLDEARTHHEESLTIKREIGDLRGISTSLSNLAMIYEKSGFFEASLSAAEESLAIKQEIRDRMSLAYALNGVGAMLLVFGEPGAAEERHEEALRITREIGDRAEEAATLRRLGEVRREQGQASTACRLLQESLGLAREVGVREGEMEACYALGLACIEAGRLAQACEAAGAMRGAERTPESRAKRAHLQAKIAGARGDGEEAVRRYEEALDAAAEVGLRDLQWRLHAGLAEVRPGGIDGPDGSEERHRARLILEDLACRVLRPDRQAGFRGRQVVRSVLQG